MNFHSLHDHCNGKRFKVFRREIHSRCLQLGKLIRSWMFRMRCFKSTRFNSSFPNHRFSSFCYFHENDFNKKKVFVKKENEWMKMLEKRLKDISIMMKGESCKKCVSVKLEKWGYERNERKYFSLAFLGSFTWKAFNFGLNFLLILSEIFFSSSSLGHSFFYSYSQQEVSFDPSFWSWGCVCKIWIVYCVKGWWRSCCWSEEISST